MTLFYRLIDMHEHYLLFPALTFLQQDIELTKPLYALIKKKKKKTSQWPKNKNLTRQVTAQERSFLTLFGPGEVYGNALRN